MRDLFKHILHEPTNDRHSKVCFNLRTYHKNLACTWCVGDHVNKVYLLSLNNNVEYNANFNTLNKGIPKLCKPHTDIFSKNGGGLPLYRITKAGSDGGNLWPLYASHLPLRGMLFHRYSLSSLQLPLSIYSLYLLRLVRGTIIT